MKRITVSNNSATPPTIKHNHSRMKGRPDQMDLFDFLRELRKGEPDVRKSARAMRILGWVCLIGGIWNFFSGYLVDFNATPFHLSEISPAVALTAMLLSGGLFFYSASAIERMEPIGKRAGQLAIVIMAALFAGFMLSLFPRDLLFQTGWFSLPFLIFLAVILAQFLLPAYYGLRYFGRLPIAERPLTDIRLAPESVTLFSSGADERNNAVCRTTYKDALLPFGLLGTFALFLALQLVAIFAGQRINFPMHTALLSLPVFLLFCLSSIAYNFLPSPFQQQRAALGTFTGGGSIFLFNGSWPFFRLLVYDDGLEIRVMFHRFFIPYDEMDDIPEKVGFFSRGILIRSDLPGVPSGIRYQGFGMKKTVALVTQTRNLFLRQPQPQD